MSLPEIKPLYHCLEFKYTWRTYQARFLNDFDNHIDDDHLHVIAPPGSGKTVLGIEMLRRIGKKTLVLSPTLTIRNQWRARLLECFTTEGTRLNTSFNIKEPKDLTFTTYQSLHSLYKNDLEKKPEDLLSFCREAGYENVILDEAHHLKNEWWTPLFKLKEIPELTVVALTATPPYDSELSEIKRYFDLCGPIDMEIGVPELVREGNLCPHQDFIHFSQPRQEEIQYILAYRDNLMKFVKELQENDTLKNFILNHPFYSNTGKNLEAIYEAPEFYSAMLIYLNSTNHKIPNEKLSLLGFKRKEVRFPSFNYQWVTALLQPLIIDHREAYIDHEEMLSQIEMQIRRIGGLDHKKINLEGENKLFRSLSQSPTKLNSIFQVVMAEANNLGNELRMVILSDYIRKEFLDFKHTDLLESINKLGVIPIFQYLKRRVELERREEIDLKKIAVLTGSLTILHRERLEALEKKMPDGSFNSIPIGDSEYLTINPTGSGKNQIVEVITSLFESGELSIIIGTKSLLGEGWDAPAINTLILASFVGSFVTSNQMRGRAIRVNPEVLNKTANIWHIACVDPTKEDGGTDVNLLVRRFEAFCGVSSEGEAYIQNGVDRLQLFQSKLDPDKLNSRMLKLAANRSDLSSRWATAINHGTSLVRELTFSYGDEKIHHTKKKFYYKDVVKYTLIEITTTLLLFLPELIANNLRILLSKGLIYFFYSVCIGIALFFFPKMYKAIVLYLEFGRRDKMLIQIGTALKNSMVEQSLFASDETHSTVIVESYKNGTLTCFLKNASEKDNLLFLNYLEEIMEPVNNPRYVIISSEWFRKKLGFHNYFSVPGVFDDHKKKANVFSKNWRKHVGGAELVFTRNMEGRKLLLKARFHYLKQDNDLKVDKNVVWK